MDKKKNISIITEIKKEYLLKHLDEVEKFTGTWILELQAPLPFSREHRFGWQNPYTSVIEQDVDINHILRRHLRSRALWMHHTNWELKLKTAWDLNNRVYNESKLRYEEQTADTLRQFTEDYLSTALWQGFEVARGKTSKIEYIIPDDKIGLSLGAYRIENSVKSEDEHNSVEKGHQDLINEIAGLEVMTNLVDLWHELSTTQQSMQTIATKILKSNDILYPCRFCKHLWK